MVPQIPIVSHLVNWPTVAVKSHCDRLLTNLDAIKEHRAMQPILRTYFPYFPALNVHFVVPFLLMISLQLDTLWILYLHDWKYSTDIPELYTHKYFPDKLRLQGSAMANWGIFVELFTFAHLIFDPLLKSKYIMYVTEQNPQRIEQNGRWVESEIAVKLISFRRKAKLFFNVILVVEFLQCLSYFGYQVHLHWLNTPRDYILAFCLPFFCIYAIYGAICIIFYFLQSVRYIWLKQLYHMRRVSYIKDRSLRIRKSQLGNYQVSLIWGTFVQTNKQVFLLYDEFDGYNRMWSYYITCGFISYTGMICYLSYGLLCSPEPTFFLVSFFIFFLTEFVILLFVVCLLCSFIVRNSVRIYNENVKFCFTYGRYFKPTLDAHLKMDKMVANQSGTRVGFQLINGLLIDTEMFQLLFIYISTLFLKIIR